MRVAPLTQFFDVEANRTILVGELVELSEERISALKEKGIEFATIEEVVEEDVEEDVEEVVEEKPKKGK